jgi:hypothetical protein
LEPKLQIKWKIADKDKSGQIIEVDLCKQMVSPL